MPLHGPPCLGSRGRRNAWPRHRAGARAGPATDRRRPSRGPSAWRTPRVSRGGIEDVTDEDDWLSEVAKLAGGHGAAVESAAKTGHESEIALIPSGVTLDRRADLEKGSDADRARRMRMRLSNAGPPQ